MVPPCQGLLPWTAIPCPASPGARAMPLAFFRGAGSPDYLSRGLIIREIHPVQEVCPVPGVGPEGLREPLLRKIRRDPLSVGGGCRRQRSSRLSGRAAS
ncbi:hypothetical protein [Methanoculleus sp.]|uniref:hypothetical protein n=1 Tax=Methanoculleus sp. TaxID=90427 RepID=UPI002613FBF8|nr:hypothetical protein [Methanoculleus sp.]MDI6867764.1 hypothetical protein [Methanoculleus sp.]